LQELRVSRGKAPEIASFELLRLREITSRDFERYLQRLSPSNVIEAGDLPSRHGAQSRREIVEVLLGAQL
jgi:hypothetical protein